MEEAVKAKKTGWFKGLCAEFKNITWLKPKDVVAQTFAVAVIAVLTGGFIALIDWVMRYGIDSLLGVL